MEQQSLAKQAVIGAFFGAILAVTRLVKQPEADLTSAYSLGSIVGGALGGIVLYMALYRIWPKKPK